MDGALEECSTVCQSQITAGTHKQEVLTGNQLLEMATKSQQKTYRPKYGPNFDNSIFLTLINEITQPVQKLNCYN